MARPTHQGDGHTNGRVYYDLRSLYTLETFQIGNFPKKKQHSKSKYLQYQNGQGTQKCHFGKYRSKKTKAKMVKQSKKNKK